MYSIDQLRFLDQLHVFDKMRNSELLNPYLKTTYDAIEINKRIKDVLSVAIYGIIFVIAGAISLIFRSKQRYYVEHLVFILHIISAAFIRNILLIPVLLIYLPVGYLFIAALNLVYVVAAIRKFYQLPLSKAILVFVPIFLTVGSLFFVTMIASAIVALWK